MLSPPSHMWFVKLCQRTKRESEAATEEESEGVCTSLPTVPLCVCVCAHCKGESAEDEWGGIAAGVSMAMMLVS